MNINDTIRETQYNATVEQLTSVVEWYIREKKGVDVKIDMYSDSITGSNRINPVLFKVYVNKLFRAYVKALEYYKNDYKSDID
jgi:hypothetical protein